MTPRERHEQIIINIQRLHKLPLDALTTTSGPAPHIAFRKHVFTALHDDGASYATIARKFGLKPGTVRAAIKPYYTRKDKGQ